MQCAHPISVQLVANLMILLHQLPVQVKKITGYPVSGFQNRYPAKSVSTESLVCTVLWAGITFLRYYSLKDNLAGISYVCVVHFVYGPDVVPADQLAL